MQCLIKGCNFLFKNVPNEVFTIDYQTLKYEFKVIEHNDIFPYLLVNIGSGVSILEVCKDAAIFPKFD
jgi:pantothenate kinase